MGVMWENTYIVPSPKLTDSSWKFLDGARHPQCTRPSQPDQEYAVLGRSPPSPPWVSPHCAPVILTRGFGQLINGTAYLPAPQASSMRTPCCVVSSALSADC